MIVINRTELRRKGFVLASVLLAVLVIAAMVAGVFFASTEATRMGVAAGDRQLALSAAESAIEATIADWDPAAARATGVGETRSTVGRDPGMPVAVYITRLDSALYWVLADAGPVRANSAIASRIGAFVRVRTVADGSASVDRISERWWSELF
ncbi:MAG TPA: hypothetical protein VLJ83_00875 [Gemmatimonadaceae bacterium]|nr:hypothetical protein [Gemmatimonadaceae bacterium]